MLIVNGLFLLLFLNSTPPWSKISSELWRMTRELLIVPKFYSRDALSSGLAPVRTADILQSSKVFRDLINQIYKLPIKGLWLLFNKSGSYPWHRDVVFEWTKVEKSINPWKKYKDHVVQMHDNEETIWHRCATLRSGYVKHVHSRRQE